MQFISTVSVTLVNVFFRNTNDVFLADFNDPSVNNMDSFDVQSPFAFLIHGFTDYYPGAVPIDGIGNQLQKVNCKRDIYLNTFSFSLAETYHSKLGKTGCECVRSKLGSLIQRDD